jgi:hypothetical protein
MAVSQLAILSFALSSSDAAVRGRVAPLLLASMVFLFRLKRRAVSWFAAYVGLSSWVAWGYALAPVIPPFFDELVSLGGLIVALGLLGYMLRLRKREILA